MPTCIIVDDEPLAIDVLKSHIENSKYFDLCATFTSPVKAFSYLEKNSVDIVFLDIQMPKLTGLEFIKRLNSAPRFIVTTAYREFAYEGFELQVFDFLVKPVSYERFLKLVAKLLSATPPAPRADSLSNPFIFVREQKKMIKIFLRDIVILESQKDYLRLVTLQGEFITRGTISYFDDWLPKAEFVRVHRSFIVSIHKIDYYTDEDVQMQNKMQIPIGDSYRRSFKANMQKHSM